MNVKLDKKSRDALELLRKEGDIMDKEFTGPDMSKGLIERGLATNVFESPKNGLVIGCFETYDILEATQIVEFVNGLPGASLLDYRDAPAKHCISVMYTIIESLDEDRISFEGAVDLVIGMGKEYNLDASAVLDLISKLRGDAQ